MAKTISALPKEIKKRAGRKKKYPSLSTSEWLNGKIWEITSKDVGGADLKKFANYARIIAASEGLGLAINWSVDEKTLYLKTGEKRAKKVAAVPKKKTAKKKAKTPF